MIPLDPFYLIVDDVAWIRRLAPVGVKWVQLRIKTDEASDIRQQVHQAQHICRQYGVQLILNDHWQIAIDSGCDFVHLGQEDLATADIEAIRAAGLRLGVSTHDDQELQRVIGLRPDYVALGPIFPTRSKTLQFSPQGLDPIRAWKRQLGAVPLVAIGGLSLGRAPEVLAAGADSLAVISDVSLHPDPPGRVRQWLAATRPDPALSPRER